jgi:hypothetical protein
MEGLKAGKLGMFVRPGRNAFPQVVRPEGLEPPAF